MKKVFLIDRGYGEKFLSRGWRSRIVGSEMRCTYKNFYLVIITSPPKIIIKKIINPRGTKKPLTKEGYNYIKVAMNTLYSGMSS